MQQEIKVSVIIPIYGVEKYIERCARSLFEQTLDCIEYIFIDDCTLDKSMDILSSVIEEYRPLFAKKHWIVRTLKMPTNSGLPAVRRHGIQECHGEYIIHCDSDDWVETTMYEKMYNLANSPKIDIVYCDYFQTDGVNQECTTVIEDSTFMLGPLWNKLVKRELYNNNIIFPTANKAEDGALMVQLSYYAKNRSHLNEALYYYYQNPESICRVQTKEACLKRLKEECANTELRIKFLESKGLEKKYDLDILEWKYTCRDNLAPLLKDNSILKIWRETYPEINHRYIFTKGIPIRSKLSFLFKHWGVYSLLIRICKKNLKLNNIILLPPHIKST